MNLELSRKQILSDLIGIGIFMSGKRTSFKDRPITPERAIVNSLTEAKNDRLVLQLVHTWLMKHADIIHVESLKGLIEQAAPTEKAILASLLSYTQNRKFEVIIKKVKPFVDEGSHGLNKMIDFAAKIGQVPFDKHFKKFGLSVSQLSLEPDKKMIPFKYVVDLNPFIKCRYIFGANWRSDIAAVMLLGDYTPTQAMKILGCSYETAHRNIKELKIADWPNINLNSFDQPALGEI